MRQCAWAQLQSTMMFWPVACPHHGLRLRNRRLYLVKAWCGLGRNSGLAPAMLWDEMFHCCMLKAYDEHLQVLAVHFLLCSMALPWERVYCGSSVRSVAVLKNPSILIVDMLEVPQSWFVMFCGRVPYIYIHIYTSVAVWNCARSCRPDCQGYSFPTSWWGKCQLASIGHWIRNCCEMCFVHWRKLLDIAVLH